MTTLSDIPKLKAFLLFVLLGPFIGALAVAVYSALALRSGYVGLIVLAVGYLTGLAPAALAGALFAYLLSLPPLARVTSLRVSIFILGSACGAVVSVVFWALWAAIFPLDYLLARTVIVPGLFAGGCCALLSLRISPLVLAPMIISALILFLVGAWEYLTHSF